MRRRRYAVGWHHGSPPGASWSGPGAGLEWPWSVLERAWSGPGVALERLTSKVRNPGLQRPGASLEGRGVSLERPWSVLERAWSVPGASNIRDPKSRPGAAWSGPGAAWSAPSASNIRDPKNKGQQALFRGRRVCKGIRSNLYLLHTWYKLLLVPLHPFVDRIEDSLN